MNIVAVMSGAGLVVGGLLPFALARWWGVPSEEFLHPSYFLDSVASAVAVALVNYLLVSRIVKHRLRRLTSLFVDAQREIAECAGTDSVAGFADRHAVQVDSDDEFGRLVEAYNYLLDALESSLITERELNQANIAMCEATIDQSRLAALGTLTAGVAHETKNPLNFVVNFAEGNLDLLDELRVGLGPDGKAMVEEIESNNKRVLHHAQRALAVMETMLEIGRKGSGESAPCQINGIVEQSARLAEQSWRIENRDSQCAISVELDDSDPVVDGFEGDLAQVVINLIMNAMEAAASGVEGPPEVRVVVSHDAAAALIAITDNGPGIAAAMLPRIYEPFFTTKADSGGTGLGLSICKDIIDNRHQGELSATNERAGGAKFVVRLPFTVTSAGGCGTSIFREATNCCGAVGPTGEGGIRNLLMG